MEGFYADISSSSKALKLKSSHGDVSTIDVQSFIGGHSRRRYHLLPNGPILDPYASPDSTNAPLIRYLLSLGGRTPLASVENLLDTTPSSRSPTVFKTPVNVEEDVLVMDGILVGPKTKSSSLRSSLTSSNPGGRSSSSGGSENNNHTNIFDKTDTCQSREDSGSKCLAQICKAHSGSGSCTYGTKCLFVAHHHQDKSTVSPTAIAMTSPRTPETVSPIRHKHPTSSSSSRTGLTSTDWSPVDDGIEVTLTCSGSSYSEDVDAYIQRVLYGPAVKKRLQVFGEFFPE